MDVILSIQWVCCKLWLPLWHSVLALQRAAAGPSPSAEPVDRRGPEAFEFVEAHAAPGGQLRRYRIRYTDRIEHVQVGLTSDERMYWAWGL